eukprot:TRINITY_DN8125_c0_g1_i1.p1 TRINITY_DN8125_c0_g1~~TRINITY_DN8125_c0_g1_i1.p1  ORF type:complete len:498 (+),score=119.33 TRINITY_DN8125_c0_g1_i1:77-1570(+)
MCIRDRSTGGLQIEMACWLRTAAALLLLVHLSHGEPPGTYRAAAVQFTKPPALPTAAATIQRVLDQFWVLTSSAAAQNASLVLFPEASLWGYADYRNRSDMREFCEAIPEAQAPGAVPPCYAAASGAQLRALSCMAIAFNITVVANMADVQPCSACNDSYAQYNTEVALDSSGILLAKYHKSHIYNTAPGFDQPADADPVFFDSSFGVRFGFIICYDIDFVAPAEQLMSRHGVSSFLFSTSWGNIPPLNTALLTQQGWARRFNVNVLAANNGASPLTAGGGLIAAGGVLLNASFSSQQHNLTTIMTADLPRVPSSAPAPQAMLPAARAVQGSSTGPEACTVSIAGDVQAGCQTVHLLPGAQHTLAASHNGLQCTAQLSVHSTQAAAGATYALVALNDTLRFRHTPDPLGLQVCGLVVCEAAPYCRASWTATATLANFTVQGVFSPRAVVLPMVAVHDAQPVPSAVVGYSGQAALWSQTQFEDPLWAATLYGTVDHTL